MYQQTIQTQSTITDRQQVILSTIDESSETTENKKSFLQAVLDGEVDVVQHLLKKGANPNDPQFRTRDNRTPISIAYQMGYLAIVNALINTELKARRANLNVRDGSGQTLLHLAVVGEESRKPKEVKLELIESLLQNLKKKKDREDFLDIQETEDNQTALHKAVVDSSKEVVAALIDGGANVNAETKYHFVPLHFAARYGNFEAVKCLVEKGALIDVKSDVGFDGGSGVDYKVSPKKRALQGSHLAIACYLAKRSGKRLEKALVKGTHPKLKELLEGDIARNRAWYELAREHYEKLFREATATSSDIRLKVCCLKKLGDFMLRDKQFVEAAKLYNLALVLYRELSPARQYQREIEPLLERLARVEICARIQEASSTHAPIRSLKGIKKAILQKGLRLRMNLSTIYNGIKWCIETPEKSEIFLQRILGGEIVGSSSSQNFMSILNKAAKQLTSELVLECIEELAQPLPCRYYAIISLGTKSWVEMLLSSDLALGVLFRTRTDSKRAEIIKYFKKLTHLLMVKLTTITNAEQLPLQKTNCGTSASKLFLGHILSPLEEEGLIDTPRGMASRLVEENILPGLSHGTANLLCGSRPSLVDDYRASVEKALNDHEKAIISDEISLRQIPKENQKEEITKEKKNRLLCMLEAELMDFSLGLNKAKEEKGSLYLKRELYRFLSEAIYKLCVYYNIVAEDTWERLRKLKATNKIDEAGYKHLCEAMNAIVGLTLKKHRYSFGKPDEIKSLQEKEMQPIFIEFDNTDKKKLVEILRVLLPLHNVLTTFCRTQNEEDRMSLLGKVLFDDGVTPEGEARERLFDYAKAQKYYEQAVVNDPRNLEARNALIRIFYKNGDYDRARAECEAIRMNPPRELTKMEQTIFDYNECVVLLQLANADQVMERCAAVGDLRISHPVFLALHAANQKNMGDIEKTRGKKYFANSVLPEYARKMMVKRALEAASNHYKSAFDAYEKLSSDYGIMQPLEAVKVKLNLAEVQGSLGNASLALDSCKDAGKLCMKPAYRYIYGEIHMEMQVILNDIRFLCVNTINGLEALVEITELCKKAIDISKELIGEIHLQQADLLENLGEACFAYYHDVKEFNALVTPTESKALLTFLEVVKGFFSGAEEIYKTAYGENHPDASRTKMLKEKVMEILEVRYSSGLQQVNKEQARIYYEKELRAGSFEEGNDPTISLILEKLVDLCFDLKEYESTVKYCKQLIAFYESKLQVLETSNHQEESSPSFSFLRENAEYSSKIEYYKNLKIAAEKAMLTSNKLS